MADDATTQTAVTDDQELAKVLANMSDEEGKQQAPEAPAPETAPEAPAAPAPAEQEGGLVSATDPLMVAPPPPSVPETPPPAPAVDPQMVAPAPAPVVSAPGDLGEIKKLALDELRPIVNELELPAKDKFDALLLVIRSSDDQSLIKSAYAAANGITDPAEKAQALLDIIKEIEYFSQQGTAPTV